MKIFVFVSDLFCEINSKGEDIEYIYETLFSSKWVITKGVCASFSWHLTFDNKNNWVLNDNNNCTEMNLIGVHAFLIRTQIV